MILQDTYSPQVAVLGSMLISPELIGEVLAQVRPDDFIDGRCRRIYEAIRSLFMDGRTIDPVTVRDKLGGGPEAPWSQLLMDIMDRTPTAANIWSYVPILLEQARLTRISEAGRALQDAQDLDAASAVISKLNGLLSGRQGAQHMDMPTMLQQFYERHKSPHEYLSWGMRQLDEQLFAELGDMVVIGGDPSSGKTALSVSFAWALSEHYRVGFYSLETNRHKLADRLVANLAGIELSEIKRGTISEEQWALLAAKSKEIVKRPIDIIEASGMTMADIRSDALAHRYQVVFIDYLQIVVPESRRVPRTEQVGQISRDIQAMAHSSGITVVALSQFSRRDDDTEPTMRDLRESGQIEQDADIIMLLYLEEPSRPKQSRRVLKIGKNKEGERGKVFLVFDGAYQRFRPSALDAPVPEKPKWRRPRRSQTSLFDLDDGPPDPDPFPARKEGSSA